MLGQGPNSFDITLESILAMNDISKAPTEEDVTPVVLRDHAWDYFALHADQRLRMFHFFIILETGLVAAMLLAVRVGSGGEATNLFWPIGVLMALLSFVFWKLDQRTKGLIKVAEEALRFFENETVKIASNKNQERFLPFLNDPQVKGQVGLSPLGILSYSKCFGMIFLAFGAVGVGVVIWSVSF